MKLSNAQKRKMEKAKNTRELSLILQGEGLSFSPDELAQLGWQLGIPHTAGPDCPCCQARYLVMQRALQQAAPSFDFSAKNAFHKSVP